MLPARSVVYSPARFLLPTLSSWTRPTLITTVFFIRKPSAAEAHTATGRLTLTESVDLLRAVWRGTEATPTHPSCGDYASRLRASTYVSTTEL